MRKLFVGLATLATGLGVSATALACPGACAGCCGSAFGGYVSAVSIGVLVGVGSVALENVLKRRR